MFEAACRLLPRNQVVPFAGAVKERLLGGLGLSGSRYFRALLLGGGTLINPSFLEITRAALRSGLPVSALGTGVGSCGFAQPDRVGIAAWKPLLAEFRRIGVRGPRSQAALNALGLENVEVVGDLALCLAQPWPQPTAATPRFAVNVTLPEGQTWGEGDYERLRDLEPAIARLIRRGWQPAPIAMHASDVAPLRHLLRSAGEESAPISLPTTAHAFFDAVAGCSFMVAVRLHAAILSACIGVPPLMLGYRDKCLDFMESVGLEAWHVSLNAAAPGEIGARMARLSEQAPGLGPQVLERACGWRRRLEEFVRNAVP
jgi:polysaccharide pyruvyl transferase WcaK-like protein